MTAKPREMFSLPFSTAECDEGPLLEHRPGHATLKYDAEGPDGIVWTALEFSGTVAVRFTPDATCAPWMVEAYTRVCEIEDSEWAAELRSATRDGEGMLPASAHHFFVYFDHVGCWEVLADAVRVNDDS